MSSEQKFTPVNREDVLTTPKEVYEFMSGALREAIRDRETAEKLGAEAEYRAAHDHLTGLLSPAGLEKAVEQFMQAGKKPAVIVADVVNLKSMNDKHPLKHAAGDRLLQDVAALLQKSVRPETIVARMGGDEFIIVFDANENRQNYDNEHEPTQFTPEEKAEVVRKRINAGMELHLLTSDLHEVNSGEVNVHISTGAGIASTYEEARLIADRAMYEHKQELHSALGGYR